MLTVSPVRHVKDGVHENNLSKSVLLLLTDFLVKTFDQVNYFPAYELIVDDLRDYRFYKEDLIHPTKQAVDYVFDKFSETHFSEKTKQGVSIQKAMLNLRAHRSLHFSDDTVVTEKLQKLEREFAQLINAQL
jgi:GSCFA family